MKTLHLIRHAKSSWDDASLSDELRPLKKRGLNDCQLMAKALANQAHVFERIHCSSARRAQMTIERLLSHSNLNQKTWHTESALYTSHAPSLLDWWQNQKDAFNHLTQLGHNSAMTDLIEHLTGESIGNFPTCAYAQLKFNGHHWRNLSADSCQLTALITPKQLRPR